MVESKNWAFLGDLRGFDKKTNEELEKEKKRGVERSFCKIFIINTI